MSELNETREISLESIRHIVEAANNGVSIKEKHELIFVIRGMIERVILPDDDVVTLGRADADFQGALIDLTPYGAVERGVSRVHARVQMTGEDVYITDLGSRNGTFVNGTRLEANHPVKILKGHDIQLGNLPVQVMFRSQYR